MRVLPVAGTWAYDGLVSPDEWYHPHSAFFQFLKAHGLEHADPDEPFVWDGEVDGAGFGIRARAKHTIWRAAADNLAYRLRRMPLADRNLIAHSHGGQVACYAAAKVPINRLVTVAMPVREDMAGVYRAVVPLGGWVHLHSDGSDRMQWLGSLFDGAWGVERRVLIPGVQNIGIPRVSHSRILNEPALFHWWVDAGVIPFLQGMGV